MPFSSEDQLIFHVWLWMFMYLIIRRRRRADRWLNREWLVRPINQLRNVLGHHVTLFQELKHDPIMFHRYTGMNLDSFNFLYHLLLPHITKNHPNAIHPEARLAMTLRYRFKSHYKTLIFCIQPTFYLKIYFNNQIKRK